MPSFARVWCAGSGDCSTRWMISSFSVAEYLMRRPPQPRSRFFSATGSRASARPPLLQCAGLAPQLLDLIRGRRSRCVAGQALFAGLQKLLRPAVIEVLDDPLAAA